MATIICDGCGGRTDSDVYCDDCFKALEKEVEELKAEIERLENEEIKRR